MSDPPGRSVVKLRLNYDRDDVTVEELRSPRAGTLLENPRPTDVDPTPQFLDEHPEGYDIETVAWGLPPDTRVTFTIHDGSARELKVENIICLFPDEEYPDTSTSRDAGDEPDTDGEIDAEPESSGTVDDVLDGSAVADERHELTLTVLETREVRVTPDRFTGYQQHPETTEVVEYKEGPIRCSCGAGPFTETDQVRTHIKEAAEIGDGTPLSAPGPFNNSLVYYDGDDVANESPSSEDRLNR